MSNLKCIAISCVRNEADIIEAFVRHTLFYCHSLIILDHASTDATPQILHKLQLEGLALHVVQNDTLGHMQVANLNFLLKKAAVEFEADWIICLDADEFISGHFSTALFDESDDKKMHYLKVRLRNYYARPVDVSEIVNPVIRITHRLIQEPCDVFKSFIPGCLARNHAGFLTQGSHEFYIGGVEASFKISEDVWLAHFSIRSPFQYGSAVVSKFLQRLRYTPPRQQSSFFYDKVYERIIKSYSSFIKNFHQESLAYLPLQDITEKVIKDPLHYHGGNLKYTAHYSDVDEFISRTLAIAEKLAPFPEENNHPTTKSPNFFVAIRSQENGKEIANKQIEPEIRNTLYLHLDNITDNEDIFLHFYCDVGMIEIYRFTFIYNDSFLQEYSLPVSELQNELHLLTTGSAMTVDREHSYCFFTSALPVYFRYTKKDKGNPIALVLELRYQRQISQEISSQFAKINQDRLYLSRYIKELERLKTGYRLGQTIHFSEDGLPYLEHGWSHAEPWGRWTDGDKALLKLFLQKIPEVKVQLVAVLRGFVHSPNAFISADIYINDDKLSTWKVTDGDFKEFNLIIPAKKCLNNPLEILFKINCHGSPFSLGLSNDKRQLGLAFQKLILY